MFFLGPILAGLKLGLALFQSGLTWAFAAGCVLMFVYLAVLPPGWPNWWIFHAPYAGAVQAERAKAKWNADQWNQCKVNEGTLRSAIASQNAAVDRLAAQGLRAREEAEKAVQGAKSGLARASQAKAAISAPLPAGDDVCASARVVDQRFTESLR